MTYGMLVNEGNEKKGSFEYHRLASDGKAYGIFKECSKYYIKSAPAEKQNLSEAYDYIGGWNNRKDYEYDSYAMALKQFDLKMMSINEACGAKANATTLDPSKKGDLVIEGTEKMRAEIARQRQIMFNTATIIREGSYIGVGDPERVSGSNDADKPYTQKGEAKLDKDMPKAKGEPDDQSEPYGDGKAPEKGKDVKSGDVLSKGTPVAAEHPGGGKVTHVDNINEDCKGCVNNSAPNGARDWGTEGIGKGNGDPKENGWEMDGQEYVNEEINDAKEWDEGLPGSAGTGEADTAHNNDPYKENINEDSWDDQFKDKTGVTFESKSEGDDEYDVEGDADGEEDVEGDADGEAEPEGGEEEVDLGGDDELGGEDDADLALGDDDELGAEDFEDEGEGDLEAEIAQLRAEVEALKAQLGGEEAPAEPMGDELGGEEAPVEDGELGGEEAPVEGGDLNGEEIPAEPGYEGEPTSDEDIQEGVLGHTMKQAFKQGYNQEDGLGFVGGGNEQVRNYRRNGLFNTDQEIADKTVESPISYQGYEDSKAEYNHYKNNYPNHDTWINNAANNAVDARPGLLGRAGRSAVVGAYNLGTAANKIGGAIKGGAQAVKRGVQAVGQGAKNFVHNTVGLEEAKQAYMNNLVNEVVNNLVNEGKNDAEWKKRFDFLYGGNPFNEKEMDKQFGPGAAKKAYGDTGSGKKKDEQECVNEDKTVLHDFGNHPGYRKKPMDLPPTGSDNVDGKRDWNDDSVHNEEPFGKTIGDGKPYDKLVQVITDSIMEDIKKKM